MPGNRLRGSARPNATKSYELLGGLQKRPKIAKTADRGRNEFLRSVIRVSEVCRSSNPVCNESLGRAVLWTSSRSALGLQKLFSSPSASIRTLGAEGHSFSSIMSSIQISLHDDLRKMTDSLGRFRADMRTKVVRRALTKVGRRANTEAVRAVRAEYKVPSKAVRNALSTRVTTDDAMEVALSLKGAPTPLADLNPRAYGGPSGWPTRGGKGKVRRPGGVTVKIKGKKYKIPHAFIATMSSGHVGVFARGGRSKVAAATGETYGSFSFSSQRLPITELFTFSLAQAFRNDKVLRQVVQRVTRDFSGLLAHEIEWQLGRSK